MDCDNQIKLANDELKANGIEISIKRRNNKLYLRGTLPPKPGKENKGYHRQEIAIGLNATTSNIAVAQSEAVAVADLLRLGKFDWRKYGAKSSKTYTNVEAQSIPILTENIETIESLVERFSEWYLSKGLADGRRPFAVKNTLKKDYLSVFKKLDYRQELSLESVSELILSSPADSRTRKRAKNAIACLAKFAGITLDLTDVKSSYSTKNTAPRKLPTDEEIESCFLELSQQNESWGYFFGILATFGLRPQEPFYSNLKLQSCQPFLEVLESKNKTNRTVLPYPSKWVEQFNLWQPNLPPVSIPDYWDVDLESDLSGIPCEAFKTYGVPFPPYHLRHAWAVRTLLMGLDVSLAAKQMDHSVKVHTDTYHYWINKQVQLEAWKKANSLI